MATAVKWVAAVVLLANVAIASVFVDDELDAVVIEAPKTVRQSRQGRQFPWVYSLAPQSYQTYQSAAQQQTYQQNACYSDDGKVGQCVSVRQCYPFYGVRAEMPDWLLGQRSACSAYDSLTRQTVQGICCSARHALPQQFPGGTEGFYPGLIQQPGQGAGGIFGGFPGFGFPGLQPGGVPGVPGGQQPVQPPPDQTGGLPPPQGAVPPPPPAGEQPGQTGDEDDGAVVEQGEPESPSAPAGKCGVGRYANIKYDKDGTDEEAKQRVTGEHPLRVVNGWPADKNEWPWIAALLRNGRQFCGGSLIDDRHILTAAHCVATMSAHDVQMLTVRLGAHNIRDSSEPTFETPVARVVRHKGFSSETLWNDVALITLSQPVPSTYSDTVRPVCLPSGGEERYAGKMATVVGWGSLRENGPQPDILQELSMEVWENGRCSQTYGQYAPGGITNHMLCAGQQGKDSCSGDSGGPMVVPNGNQWEQIGIVSWGIGCGKAHYPGVYTRTTDMRPWIDKVKNKF